jgi:hypothetical protein
MERQRQEVGGGELMDEQPKHFSRNEILERFWPEFYELQKTEYLKRKHSGWGVAKGQFTESAFWEWILEEHKLEDGA